MMVGIITVRTLDYFELLVAASIVALVVAYLRPSASSTRSGGRRGCGQQASLVLHWPPHTAWGSCCEERNRYLAWSSRAILKKMKPSLKRGNADANISL